MRTKFHEIQILVIFGLGLQIIIHLMILASKARDANTMDMPRRPRPPVVSIRLASLALEAKIIKCIMIWSPRPTVSNIWISWNLVGWAASSKLESKVWRCSCSKFPGMLFSWRKKPCEMQLADPGLVNSQISRKPMKCVISHAQNSQERCFCGGKSPCGTHSAGQGLVKMNSGKT